VKNLGKPALRWLSHGTAGAKVIPERANFAEGEIRNAF
jgi:hypothetical protein